MTLIARKYILIALRAYIANCRDKRCNECSFMETLIERYRHLPMEGDE